MKLNELLNTKLKIQYDIKQTQFNTYTSIKDSDYSVQCEQYKLYNNMYDQLKELGANIKIDDSSSNNVMYFSINVNKQSQV